MNLNHVLHPEAQLHSRALQNYTRHPPQLKLPIVEPDYVLDPGAQLHSRATKSYTAPSPAQLAYCETRPCTTPWMGSSFIHMPQSYTLHPPKLNLPIVEPDHALHPGGWPNFICVLQRYTLHPPKLNLLIVEPYHVLHPGGGPASFACYNVIHCTLPSSTCPIYWNQTMHYTLEGASFIRVLQCYTLHPPKRNLSIVEPDHVLHPGGGQLHSRVTMLYTAPSQAQLAYCGTRPCTTPWRGPASFACYEIIYCTFLS